MTTAAPPRCPYCDGEHQRHVICAQKMMTELTHAELAEVLNGMADFMDKMPSAKAGIPALREAARRLAPRVGDAIKPPKLNAKAVQQVRETAEAERAVGSQSLATALELLLGWHEAATKGRE